MNGWAIIPHALEFGSVQRRRRVNTKPIYEMLSTYKDFSVTCDTLFGLLGVSGYAEQYSYRSGCSVLQNAGERFGKSDLMIRFGELGEDR